MRQSERKLRPVWGMLLLGLGFMGYGIIRQEHLSVLKKAVNICLECIGVG